MESWPVYARTLRDRYCKTVRRLRFKYAAENANVEAGMFCRYSDYTIQAVEMLDADEKINLELIVLLIRHVVLNEGVSSVSRGSSL